MLAQILLAALVLGMLILIINIFHNRFVDKPLKWNALRRLAYLFVAVASVGLTAMNPSWFNSFEGYFCAVPLAAFMPAGVEWVCTVAAENLRISKKVANKAESS